MPTNAQVIDEALRLLTAGLRRYVERDMKRVHGARWQEIAAESLRMTPKRADLDLSALLSVILNNQRSVFSAAIGPREAAIVREVREVRNEWAHQQAFAPADLHRALDSVRRLLVAIGEPEGKDVAVLAQAALRQLQDAAGDKPDPSKTDDLPRRVIRATPTMGPKGTAKSDVRTWTSEGLLAKFVEAFECGRPCIASYSWVYGRLFGSVPRPWSQGHGVKVVSIAKDTPGKSVKGLGAVALDTFVVGTKDRLPAPGYWRNAPCDAGTWKRVLGGALLLHGEARAPWE